MKYMKENDTDNNALRIYAKVLFEYNDGQFTTVYPDFEENKAYNEFLKLLLEQYTDDRVKH